MMGSREEFQKGLWKFMRLWIHYLDCSFKTHQFVHVKYMQSTVCKLYFNKAAKKIHKLPARLIKNTRKKNSEMKMGYP